MKVKLAAQVFSASVAAGLNTYISLGCLPQCAMATATFVSKMDSLFDILNSQTFKAHKIMNKPLRGTESKIKFLLEMLDLFKILKVLNYENTDVTKKMKFINGWRITINSILGIWKHFKENTNIKYLCTRRFNQDVLENFFDAIRQQGGNCQNPTPIMFARAFRKLFSLNYFHFAEGFNCVQDLDSILVNLGAKDFEQSNLLLPNTPTFNSLVIDCTDYQNLDLSEENALIYVVGYFFFKCLHKHKCEKCIAYSQANKEILVIFYAIFVATRTVVILNLAN